jgi:hypothetical protein
MVLVRKRRRRALKHCRHLLGPTVRVLSHPSHFSPTNDESEKKNEVHGRLGAKSRPDRDDDDMYDDDDNFNEWYENTISIEETSPSKSQSFFFKKGEAY